ncbi:MAG: UDP-galactopyranose mutase [Prevotella buccae]|jgi:UDP-galactopyranose mutase|uniref:UDP-galactopyranose mutase n=1 Tax=Segatella buccae TaxID=28126 RepID=UPI0001C416B1|nr:UDP-galactopyranose mutase [Segatella buccae]EFC75668.1 UDP-galactopyranose mutase [Segatella buccae D17]MBS5895579.1 UDP-galactopyranose mutase [Segatella buccae]
MEKYDYLIVGSGLFGATFAYRARQAGKRCLVIDKRPHLGGNVYCESVEGINVHVYGAHIFHTSNKRVWNFVNSIVEFNRYTNSPVANYKGRLYNLPFNMNTFYAVWGVTTPAEAQAKLDEQRAEAVARMQADGATEPRNLEEQAQVLIGRDIYERLIKGYTEKQWGRKCTELPAFIIKRLPVRMVFDNNYFNDAYQGIPIGGYNKLIDGLLAGVETVTGVDFFDIGCKQGASGRWQFTMPPTDGCTSGSREAEAATLVYTGQLDEFFGYRFGKLNYRTVRFETEVLNEPNHQGNAVVNYTEADVPYTRIIEHKHFESFGPAVYANPKTVVSREYSTEWQDGMEPYYPVNDEKNSRLAGLYRELAATMRNIVFGGRLAEYKYYDMAPIIEQVLGMEID